MAVTSSNASSAFPPVEEFLLAPAGVVGEVEDVLPRGGEVGADGEVFGVLEEALAGGILAQAVGEAGYGIEPAPVDGEGAHAVEGRGLPVDGAGGRPGGAPGELILADLIRGQGGGPRVAAEEGGEMGGPAASGADGSELPDLVVLEIGVDKVPQGRPLGAERARERRRGVCVSTPSVFHALGRHGYRLRSLTAYSPDHPSDRFPGAEGAVRYTIPSPYGSYRDYVDSASAQLLDLSLFRHAPHGVKARIYRDDRWLFQQWIEARRGAVATAWRSFGDTVFLQEFTSRITAAGDAPLNPASFLHLITPHPPISTDAECVYPGRRLRLTRAGYLAQAQCALRVVRTLLDRLRDLGLYDRSAIIVTSDHGLALFPAADHPLRGIGSPAGRSLRTIESDATPLLLIKPFGAQGPLQTSDAPTAITDLPATLLDLAGLPNTLETGTSALALDPARPRERTYAYHSWGGRNTHTSRWFDVLHLFSVDGRVTDPAAWRYRRAIFEPADDRAAQRGAHRIGLWADEDAAEPAAGRRTYVSGEYAAFFVPADTGRVTFDVRKAPALAAQTVTVRVDGRVVDRRSLTDDAWHTLDYAVEARDADNSPLCVELLVSPAWRTADDNPRGVLLRGDL